MQKWKIWTGVFAVFCLGAAAGALSMQTYIKQSIVADFQGLPKPPNEEGVVGHLDREVGLREEQKVEIRKIFADLFKKIEALSKEKHELIEALVAETDAAVAKQLDPVQKEKFLALVERMKKMRQKRPPPPPHFGGPQGPPPPPPHGEGFGPPPFGGPEGAPPFGGPPGHPGPPPGGHSQPPPPRSPQP